MKLFDCNCSIGFSNVTEEQQSVYALDLLNNMKLCGINEALVWNVMSRNYDPCYGNFELIKMVGNFEELHPCWVITPYQPEDFFKPLELMELMAVNRVNALRIWPSSQWSNFSMKPWVMDGFYKVFEEFRIPLFIDVSQINWDVMFEIANKYKQMPIVITGLGYRDGRFIYPVMEMCNNVFIEISMYKVYQGIEQLVKRFGSDRLLFGTGYPKYSAGSAIALVSYCDLDEKDKANISFENIKKLLEKVQL